MKKKLLSKAPLIIAFLSVLFIPTNAKASLYTSAWDLWYGIDDTVQSMRQDLYITTDEASDDELKQLLRVNDYSTYRKSGESTINWMEYGKDIDSFYNNKTCSIESESKFFEFMDDSGVGEAIDAFVEAISLLEGVAGVVGELFGNLLTVFEGVEVYKKFTNVLICDEKRWVMNTYFELRKGNDKYAAYNALAAEDATNLDSGLIPYIKTMTGQSDSDLSNYLEIAYQSWRLYNNAEDSRDSVGNVFVKLATGEEFYPVITSSLILSSAPYVLNQTVTAKFKITNQGLSPITLKTITVGGRLVVDGVETCPNNNCPDFTHRSVTLYPDEPYTYEGQLTLTSEGNYHFFTAFETTDEKWNTSILTASGVTNTLDISVISDSIAPTISLTSPTNSSTASGTITVSASASDSTGVSKVEFYKDNALQFSDSSSPYSWSWNTTDTSNGNYPISAKAYDASGNSATSSTISVTVSNSAASGGNNAPSISGYLTQYKSDGVTGMGAGATTDERTIVMKGPVSDPDSDTVSLEVEIKTVGTAFSNSPSSNCVSSGFASSGGTAVVTCSGLADGQYKWQARAKDSKSAYSTQWTDAGYSGDVADIIVSAGTTAVNNPPTVIVISPNGGETWTAGSSYTIKWSAIDDTGTIDKVEIYNSTDGGVTWSGPVNPDTTNMGVYTWTPSTTTTQGRIKVVATDSSGAQGSDMSDGSFGVAVSCTAPSTPTLWEIGTLSETGAYNISWSSVSGISSYTLQESTNSSFTSPIEYSATSQSTSVSGKSTNTYYYRVKSNNSCGSSGWSNTVYIPVSINQPPNSPSNPSPVDGASNVSRTTTLSWSGGDAEGAVTYAVRFGTTSNPPSYAGYGTVTGSSYQVPFTLEPGTTYYWGIYAKDSKGIVTEGPVWRFTTEYSYADLVPTSLTITGTAAPDVQVTLNLTVKNNGSFTAPGAQAFFYLSSASGGKEQKLNNSGTTLPQLVPGEETTISQTVTLSSLKAGQSYIDAWIDTQSYFTDGSLNNNTYSYSVNYQDAYAPVISYLGLSWGTLFKPGQEYCIVYEATDDISVTKLDFYYSTDNGVTWKTITTGFVPGSNGYSNGYLWTIPSDVPITDQLKIKMTAWDGSVNSADKTAGPYTTISGVVPTVTLFSPNGGEVWDLGSTQTITWSANASNGIGQMDLYLYYGSTASHIADVRTNTSGSYTWTIPNASGYVTNSAKIKIAVTDLNGNESEDWSDNYFTIRDASAPPSVPWTTPELITNGGGSEPRIAVDASGVVHMVYLQSPNIFYKKREGSTWSSPITVHTYDSSSYGLSELRIAVNSQGYPSIVWKQSVVGSGYITDSNQDDIFHTHFNGSSWSTPLNLSDNIPGTSTLTNLTWSNKSNLPSATNSAASAVANGKLYLLGGSSYRGRNYEYDPNNNTWTSKAEIPDNGISEGGATVINGKIYAIGDPFDNTIKVYDPSTDSWTTGAKILTTRRYMSVAAVNGKLYAIGGGDGSLNPFATVEEYNPATNTWTSKTSMPTARYGAAVAVVDNKIYVIGGNTGGVATNVVEVYDPSTDVWTQKTSMSSRRSGSVGAVVNNKVYVIGGAYYSYLTTVEEYDPATNSWLTKTSMLTARMFAGGGAIGSNIYVVGGINDNGDLSVNEQVTITSSGSATASNTPSLSVDPSNNVHVVWRDGYSYNSDYTITGASNIYYRKKDSSGNWSSTSQLTSSGGASEPLITADANGNSHLVYGFDSNKIAYMKWNGTSWSSPTTVSTTSSGFIDVAVDKSNNPHAVWFYNDSTDGQQILYSYHDGAAWSMPEKVSNAALEGYPLRPSIVVDSSNRTHVIYEENKNKNRILYKYKDSNGWSSHTQINLNSQLVEQYSSDMAISPDDNIHVVWQSSYDSYGEVFYNHADVSGMDISSPTVSVTSPSSGSTLSIGSTSNITWTATDNTVVTSITLEYSTDGGSSYTLIDSGEANDGAYEWAVPNIVSSDVIIRVSALDETGNQGVGQSGVFSISDKSGPSITLTSPNGGEAFEIGTMQTITWTASDNVAVSAIDLSYSTDGGNSWLTIATGYTNAGSYSWTIPSAISTNCMIKVVAYDSEGRIASDSSNGSFSILSSNSAPLVPYGPTPIDKGVNISVQSALSWAGGDADTGDSVTYTVYFGTSSEPTVVSNGQTSTTYNPGQLAVSTTYYWKVVASDGKASSESPVWSFTTGSEAVATPTNLAFSSVTAKEVNLSWADNSNNETGYALERKTGTNGSYAQIAALSADSTSYTDQGLNGNTTYIYRIRASNADAVSTYSAELMVTTANNAPNAPASPIPASSIGSQSVNTILSWTGGDADYSDTVTYDVYFGTSSNPSLISSGQAETYFSPGTLAYSSVYYWRVDATDNHGNISVGPTWYFVTELPDTIPPTVTINTVSTPTNTTSQTITGTVEAGATVNVATDTAASNGAATVTDTTWSYTITGLEEGANNITVTATDAAGNTAMATAVVVLDTIVPVLTLSTLSNNSVTNNNTLNISGTATDNTGVQGLTINGNPVTINADGSFSHALVLSEGANVITTVATDLTGNQTTDTRTITLDITAPALAISTPADNSKMAASIATVTGTIDENSTVAVTLNGGTPQYASVTGSTFTLDIVLASGINTIEVTATDTAGNTSTQSTQKRTVTYDPDSPSLAITDPAQDIRTNQGSMVIKGTVSDALTAVSVSVTIDGNTYTPTVTDGQFEQAITFTTEKTYTVTVTATDEAGNTATVQRNIIYDITQPIIDFTVTTPTNNTSQTITGSMEEGATVTVTSATATIGTVTYPSTTTWRVNVTGMMEGSNTITATAKDAAGNETTVAKEIVVDTIVPDTTITSQPAALTNSASASFSFTSTEFNSTFECQLDSGGYSTCTSPKSYSGLSAGSHTFYVKATDPAGSTDATPASYSWIIDTTVPAFSSTSPSSDSFINTAAVGFTLSKDVSSGKITFTRTGGSADSSAHVYNFTSSDITAGTHSVNTGLALVNGAIYTVTFEATDEAGNTGSVSNTNITFDTTTASVTIISPAANSVTNNAEVSYTLSEDVSAGDVVFTRTGGASDSMSLYTYTLSASERTTGNHTVDTGKTLMDGTIYTVSFENIKDIAGNSTAAVSNTNVTYDSTSVAITGTSPASNSIITTATVSYTLSEQAQSGRITFTWSGGTADGSSPHIYTMTTSDLTAAAHTVTTGLVLVDGAFYTVTFEATDLIGNPATTVSNAMLYYDSGYGTGPIGNVDSSGASANRVDGFDLIKLSLAFGSRSGDANWNPACDLDSNGVIEGNDLIVLGSHFGEAQ